MNLSSLLNKKLAPALIQKLETVSNAAKKLKLKPYLVGGVVRDLFLPDTRPTDCDVTIVGGSCLPLAQRLAKSLKADLTFYPQFLTATLQFPDGTHCDLITARQESYAAPATLPIVKKGSLETDIARRDFSVNAMACSLSQENWGELIDRVHGTDDLRLQLVRILHSRSFVDDPTRIFRAARFSARFQFDLEKETIKLLRESVQNNEVRKLSTDRIRTELEKILKEKSPGKALALLSQWNVLRQVDPDLRWNLNLFETDVLPLAVQLAALLINNDPFDTETFLIRMNFPNEVKERALEINRIHQTLVSNKPVTKIDRKTLFPETNLFFENWIRTKKDKLLQKKWHSCQKWIRTQPLLNGNDLKKMGFSPGPSFRKILQALAIAQFQGKVKNRASALRTIVDNLRRD
ncbi:MAG: CCA tRNA nucleotidyltransferase [Elusimicrobia bacterium]|nr:CCA tRNA nucleotidyltransferase [Elusimicrobiota bacterium]